MVALEQSPAGDLFRLPVPALGQAGAAVTHVTRCHQHYAACLLPFCFLGTWVFASQEGSFCTGGEDEGTDERRQLNPCIPAHERLEAGESRIPGVSE